MPSGRERVLRGQFLLGLAVSGVLLAWLFATFDFRGALREIAAIRGWPLALALGATVVSLGSRTWRWQLLFPRLARPALWPCFRVLALGNLANNVLPGRGGDVVRWLLAGREFSGTGAGMVLATMAVEKLLDLLALVAVVAMGIALLAPPAWVVRLGVLAGVLGLVALGFFLALARGGDRLAGAVTWTLRKVGLSALEARATGLIRRFAEGLQVLGSPWRLVPPGLATVAVWASEAALISSLALSLDVRLSLAASATVAALLGLGLMIPSSPGFLGTYEFFTLGALALFGVTGEKALALTLAMHGWMLLGTTLPGLVGLTQEGLGLGRLYGLVRSRPMEAS